MRDDTPKQDPSQAGPSGLGDGRDKAVLKLPIVWLIAFIIMMAFTGLWGTIYFTPYATDIYELGNIGGGAVGTAKYGIAIVVAISAGLIADKIGAAKLLSVSLP